MVLSRKLGLLPLIIAAIACGDEDDGPAVDPTPPAADDDDSGPDGPEPTTPQEFTVNFSARAGDTQIACGQDIENIGTSSSSVSVEDFRIYISNLRLIDGDGEAVPLTLEQDGVFQVDNIALLDFEDGSGNCQGNDTLNTEITGEADIDDIAGITFEIGVPFDQNHLDIAQAESPLNIPELFWVWRVGYKFMKIDLRVGDTAYPMHLGSFECVSDAPVSSPSEACGRPNLPTIQLDGFDPETNTIVLDLDALLSGVDVSFNTPDTGPGCQSATSDQADCEPIFDSLGLSFESGVCEDDCSAQTFVTME